MRVSSAFLRASVLVIFALLFGAFVIASEPEEGKVTGRIEKANGHFLRDYGKLEYKGQDAWEAWGRERQSLGWIVVRGDSGKMKDYVLLVIDSRTAIRGTNSAEGRFSDLHPGTRVRARYRMGWDALHALRVEILDE